MIGITENFLRVSYPFYMSDTYMILLVDRKHAKFFLLQDGVVISTKTELHNEYVPQKVKHGDDTWDAQDKIFRHIQNHLHRYLQEVAKEASDFARQDHIVGIVIGGHKQLFQAIKKHLPYPWKDKVKGYFVTELKVPFNEILKRAKKEIDLLEGKQPTKAFTHV